MFNWIKKFKRCFLKGGAGFFFLVSFFGGGGGKMAEFCFIFFPPTKIILLGEKKSIFFTIFRGPFGENSTISKFRGFFPIENFVY